MLAKKLISSSILVCCTLLACNQAPQIQQEQSQLDAFSKVNKNKIPKPEVITTESPNKNDRPEGAKITAIVLHHTASINDAKAIAKFFSNPNAQVSSHYIVDKTGYLVQPVQDNMRSWHAGKSQFQGQADVNNFSIGIEICNLGDNKDVYPDAEYDATIRLVAYLMQEYNIPLSNITRHRDIAIPAGRKSDTSDNFSTQRVLDGVKAMLKGEYNPPAFQPVKPVNYPEYREIITQKDETSFNLIADEYLDNEVRAGELELLNPNIKDPANVPAGTKVKIPNTFKLFELSLKKK